MNILYDHIPATLIADLPEFVAQVDDPDLLNLFLSGLRNEDVTRSMYTGPKQLLQQTDTSTAVVDQKTTLICRAIRPVLQATADPRFMPTILTSFMCETPPNIPAALQLLAPLSTEERDSALTYLLFLSDVDTVYNAALGLYDLPLALLVAQRSQRDPREYLPALGQLNALSSELYRRFKIDAQLGRCELAIEHLCAAYSECTVDDAAVEASRWAELAAYVVEHKLYQDALRHLTAADQHRRYSDMCLLYGDYQASMRQWKQAAASYLVGGAHSRAVDSFVQSTDWRKALALASNHASTNSLQNIHDTAIHASAVLAEHHLFGQAATVLLEYTDRDEEAIALLVKGSLWADALRYSLLRQRNDLIETTVRPGLRDAHASLLDDIDEIATAFDSKLARLREVRAIPLEALLSATFPSLSSAADADSNADGDGNLDNVDVMSDTSSMATTSRFSTFSATVTNASSSSRMTGSTARRMSKSRRKEERRKVHGKKGTIYEEAYLVDSLAKLVDRVRVHQSSAHAMNIAFIQFGWMPAASKLQSNFAKLVASVLDSAGFVFDEQRAQMQFGKNGQLEMAPPVINEQGLASQPKHPKPVLPSNDNWRIDTLV
ncbi:putative elongator complex protein 1 [Coemansia sp. RSA 2320]|nr:putative elongator complex protein 1 [Coemansia sp. RSA 2320]